ncbi:sigma-54-dependent transcriptional regulator [Terasakiella pusilla]|uniref:sigma-54-dependent transcriptional regulator n=1 Tax=Terasakiella pusilla TaxID=64973 RepID=UPI003AA8DB5B
MTGQSSTPSNAVLISWVSVNHRAAPLIPALKDINGKLGGRVQILYLCYRDVPGDEGQRERDSLKETVETLKRELKPHCPEIIKCPWKTSAAPTDHDEIRKFAENVLQDIRKEHPADMLVIHMSPGTPAMHAVWLTLGSTGFVPGPLKLIQTSDQRALGSGKPLVQVVDFRLDTVLRRYFQARPYVTQDADDGQVWNPSAVKSQALKEALETLRKWAPLRTPVLLLGERGTGKTTLANYLRAMSPFQKQQNEEWPSVVCGQFRTNPQLARSELFGHAKGAFTGANKKRIGLLEQADGDTIFFDEIADIDRDTQRLLIGAIEGRGFRPLGDAKLVRPNFRIVCATNRTVSELRKDCLDPDFYDRLAIFVLTVPPLRDCTEDIPLVWSKVLTQSTNTAALQPLGWERFSNHPHLLRQLMQHPLPGNFRDLQRVAFHLLAELNAGTTDDAAVERALHTLSDEIDAPLDEFTPRFPVKFDLLLGTFRRRWFSAAIEKAKGNVTEAARLLGIPRETLKHHISKE